MKETMGQDKPGNSGNSKGRRLQKSGLQLTEEQRHILSSKGNIRINAVAGSGKTSTVIEYASTRPPGARILYLAFNKSVKLEAAEKFKAKGLDNITVETAHSLAYKHIVFRYGYEVRPQGYKNHEIAAMLRLKGNGEKHAEVIIANHISRFVAYFCNSDKRRVQDLNYLDVVTYKKTKAFVTNCYNAIEKGTRQLLAKMNHGEIAITHDFYLKKFQLECPQLPYDYILFDEGQDASGAMMAAFLQQQAVKVIVGDTHQQIYSWRFAVNSLEQTDFPTYLLSSSFRFSQPIANLAMAVLGWKELLGGYKSIFISGLGASGIIWSKAIIARTNLGLLVKAIAYISDNPQVAHIHFEGQMHAYLYAEDGASLYDVLNLSNGRHSAIRDPLLASMQDLAELELYIEQTEDPLLAMMVEMVKKYGTALPGFLKQLKEKHIANKQEAAMVFSTVHRAKGMEYDSVELANDFITEARVHRLLHSEEAADKARLAEEINLLYVAVTRCRYQLIIPEVLLPKDFPPAAPIQLIKTQPKEKAEQPNTEQAVPARRLKRVSKAEKDSYEMAYFFKKQETAKSTASYKPWTREEDKTLLELYEQQTPVRKIAQHFGRTEGAVMLRIRRLSID